MSETRCIAGTGLTQVRVSPCGQTVELGFIEASGSAVTLNLSHEALGMLLMTLPRLIEMSLRLRTGDPSLRHVYPVGDWCLEAATDEASLLLSLSTPDGFAVSFCLPACVAESLGSMLSANATQSLAAGTRATRH